MENEFKEQLELLQELSYNISKTIDSKVKNYGYAHSVLKKRCIILFDSLSNIIDDEN